MSLPNFDYDIMMEISEANKPEKVKALSRHDEPITPFQRWIDWEGTEGTFIPANATKTLYHFVERNVPLPIRTNVSRYTILSGERYKRRRPHPGYSY